MPEMLGAPTLCLGRPHGLLHSAETGGTEYLYHINDGKGSGLPARIMKTTLDGELVWATEGPLVWPGLPWLPTDASACITAVGSQRMRPATGRSIVGLTTHSLAGGRSAQLCCRARTGC